MTISTIEVAITEKKEDVFDVDILSKSFLYTLLDYVILGKDNQLIRRGQFRAPSVQLRTTYMQDGDYMFQLQLRDGEYVNVPFHKTRSLVGA